MPNNEKTSGRVAATASQVLRNPNASAVARSLAGSALSQTHTNNTTSARVAGMAGKALENGRSSAVTQTLAGSVLTQKPGKK